MSHMGACAQMPWEHYHLTISRQVPCREFKTGLLEYGSNSLTTDIQQLACIDMIKPNIVAWNLKISFSENSQTTSTSTTILPTTSTQSTLPSSVLTSTQHTIITSTKIDQIARQPKILSQPQSQIKISEISGSTSNIKIDTRDLSLILIFLYLFL